MSDRRPSKLYVDTTEATDLSNNHRFNEPTSADLIAELRRGVESGTIKGAVKESRFNAHRGEIVEVPRSGTYLVIPVDVGEDR